MSPTIALIIVALLGFSRAKPEEHYHEGEHNKQFDREAFLGPEVNDFNELSAEESVRRLGLIVDKIDTNNDGQITHEELRDWIRLTQKMFIVKNVDRQWADVIVNAKDKDHVTWEEYSKLHYGYMYNENAQSPEEDNRLMQLVRTRDERRWKRADADKDGKLSKEEFAAFLHPEDYDHMKELIVIETMEELDKNQDGQIELYEYIGDIYSPEEHEEEPEWVRYEREQFKIYRDKDGDSVMNLDEVRDWVLPEDFDHADAEASHLIHEADSDADQKLTKAEIIDKYDLFVGSQATDFGEALTRHDEF